FNSATSFNGVIGSWDVRSVTSFYGMFYGATSFNQSVCWILDRRAFRRPAVAGKQRSH
ncbi:MAG: BspA family leucine-rich repeat surface protein, partial [Candidatus Latescibacterota bacterium]|nr:BspA family leucine-rich repeat surface protein [Candidatus Latescibacterota bacterium]